MRSPKPVFVIPTHRLRDVGATVESYDEHFRKNGHSIDMVVFDDSSAVNQQKYFPLLEQTTTQNPLWYVGPQEKEQFLSLLSARLKDRKLEPLIRNLFRPSYGGNRNWTLIYTLGEHMISADDDMRPFALMETARERWTMAWSAAAASNATVRTATPRSRSTSSLHSRTCSASRCAIRR